jgi:hypothetical protein
LLVQVSVDRHFEADRLQPICLSGLGFLARVAGEHLLGIAVQERTA